MLSWSPSCASLVAIRPFACEKKRFAQKFSDRQTDGQTTVDGRRALALAHSLNELKTLKTRFMGKMFKSVFINVHYKHGMNHAAR